MQTQKSWLIGLVVAVLVVGCSLTACLAGALIGGAVGGRIGYSMAEDRAPVVAHLSLPTWEPDWSEPPYQVPPGSEMRLAARVINVTPGGPADEAGIRPGDLILAVDDQQISLARDVADIIRDYKPGDRVQLTLLRDGREERLRVRLGRRLDDDGAVVAALDLTYRLEPVMPSR